MNTRRWGGLVVLMLISGCTRTPPALTIAAAANTRAAVEEIAKAFTSQTSIPCDIIISSSGKLAAQIQAGAPYDVFLSADMGYPAELFNAGKAVDSPVVYAYGELIIWWNNNKYKPQTVIEALGEMDHIAIANPSLAPYGSAAVEALKGFGLYETVNGKLVFGQNITQVNQFIISGTVDAGFTAKSAVLDTEESMEGKWLAVDDNLYEPIAQGLVIIKQRPRTADARRFVDFLYTPRSQLILRSYGYKPGKQP